MFANIIRHIENAVVVQIGKYNADFANVILSLNTTSMLYCIIPENAPYDSSLKIVYGDRIIFINRLSKEAIKFIPSVIDLLYINRDDEIYNDLQLYYPKIKDQGYVVGNNANESDPNNMVIQCFKEFLKDREKNDFIIFASILNGEYIIQKLGHAGIFSCIYENKLWGDDGNGAYNGSSGEGSTIENNIHTWVPFLKKFIKDNNVQSVTDLGCGSFIFGRYIYDDLDIKYHGYDGYEKFEKVYTDTKYVFTCMDFCKNKEDIDGADLCILKDVICHWSVKDINCLLDYLMNAGKFKYILICNGSSQVIDNHDILTGQWRALRAEMLPLKKYTPEILYTYIESGHAAKEVCLLRPLQK
jgi:hypothetical protein